MIRKSVVILLTLLAVCSLEVDVVGRWRAGSFVVIDGDERFAMVVFEGGQLELRSFALGDVSGLSQEIRESLRSGFQASGKAIKKGSLAGWHPSGWCFYRDSTYRLDIAPNPPEIPRKYRLFHYSITGFPQWLLSVVLLIYPTIAFIRGPLRRWSQRRRHRQGRCMNCGYDLTGNTSGVCPECGEGI